MPRGATDSTIAAGELDRRATLLCPVYNEFQDEILDWQPVAETWASVEPGPVGVELTQSQRTVSTLIVQVTIRYRRDIDARWRVRSCGHTYEVRSVDDIGLEQTTQILSCTEVL